MKRTVIAILSFIIFVVGASSSNIHHDFVQRFSDDSHSELRKFFDCGAIADSTEREAMEFLYAYMPLPDIDNYTPQFFLDNVRLSMEARKEMPWGDSVPEREFRHFVLPVRVNNEDLDSARRFFYNELSSRVKNLSMKDAILEVNHWCHEKVTYQPSDTRTSNPLSTVSQAIGRCGEESTFAVAALRSVGIPARQVYTPRWAHTDDNHAWVEAWADGRWWFLGACEPEAILNLAWFNAPASRGMLMNTRAYGSYDGPEECLARTPVNTTINVTSNYAPVAAALVKVVDAGGNVVPDATVAFSIYNYAEYYPVAVKKSDKDGVASLTCGKGDLLVWASDGCRFGLSKVNSAMPSPVVIVLDKGPGFEGCMEFDLVPPAQSALLPTATREQTLVNERRKAAEDSIRKAYCSTFATDASARAFAKSLGLDPGAMAKILVQARGNHHAIEQFLMSLSEKEREKAISVLLAVNEKDCRDIPMAVVAERLLLPDSDSPLYADYVLNPRVEWEGLVPFVADFLADMDDNSVKHFRSNPQAWVEWVDDNIALDTIWNPGSLRTHPAAVWQKRRADRLSRNIFFVASARAMGIPARIDPVTGRTQWHDGTAWLNVAMENAETDTAQTRKPVYARPRFSYNSVGRLLDPQYYYHFSISKIENGLPRLLDFDEAATLSWINRNYHEFEPGHYVLTTGQRMADGSVLARSSFFCLDADKDKNIDVEIRHKDDAVQVIGSFNSENLFVDNSATERSLLSATGRGYYVLVYSKPNHEPSAHVINEIIADKEAFEADGRKIVVLFDDADALHRSGIENKPGLPDNMVMGCDIDGHIADELKDNLRLDGDFPIVVVADTFNRVVFVSEGYTIGAARRILDILRQI